MWLRRAAIALAFGVLAQGVVIGAALYRLPARLVAPGEMVRFAVVSQRDGFYWSVSVTAFEWWSGTVVTAEPFASFEAAQARVESSYKSMELLDGSTSTRLRANLPQQLPGWLDFADHDPEAYRVVYRPERFVYRMDIRAVGWPWRCVWGEEVWAAVLPDYPQEGERHAKARQAQWSRGQWEFSENAFPLPLFPIWRGIVLDLVAFALPFLGLQIAAGAWRAGRRRRRNRCVACGYDWSGIGDGVECPECGEGNRVSTAMRAGVDVGAGFRGRGERRSDGGGTRRARSKVGKRV